MDDSDPDTQRIRVRLANYGTPQEIAEEGFRVCRVNAGLRKEVEELKREVEKEKEEEKKRGDVNKEESEVGTASTSTPTPSIILPTAVATATAITPAAAVVATTPTTTSTKALRNKIAVMQDALSEMRREAPKMRECMAWMWEILSDEAYNNRYFNVPRDLRDLYHETMDVDTLDWQPKRGGGRKGGRDGGGRKDGNRAKDWKFDGKKGDGKKGSSRAGEKKEDVKMSKAEIKDKGNKDKQMTADNVVVGGKRKGTSPLANDNKKLKIKEEERV